MTTDQRSLLIPTRHFRGLSGKVILLKYNIPALVAAGWRVQVFAEKIDAAMTRELGAEPHKIWGRGFNKRHKVNRFMRHAERFAIKQNAGLVVGHGDTLHQDVLHIHSCRHREHEESTGRSLQPGEKATADFQARQLLEGRQACVVANSRLMRDDLCARFQLDADSFKVVYPGHDPARFFVRDSETRQALRAELGVGEGVLIGLITSGKLRLRGADLLIEAVAQLPEALRSNVQLLIVGSGDVTSFEAQARAAGLADRVHFREPVQQVEALYAALDIYVNPARFETFSMSVLEAMACGIPSITTRQVGISELYTDAMQAGLMPAARSEALAQSLHKFLSDPTALAQHAQTCRELAAPLTWDSNIQAHQAIYDAVYSERAELKQHAKKS
ncbi:MAG: glycosyltransferase family 4 protein [Nevskiales bacterium]